MRRIDQTRSSIIGQLDFAWTVAQGDRGRAFRTKDGVGQYLRANPRLIGDPELLRAWAVLVLRLLEKFPHGRLEKAVWPVLKRGTDYDDLDAVSSLRSRLLVAFEAQERRSLMDQPLIFPTTEEVAAIVELERITERMRGLLS